MTYNMFSGTLNLTQSINQSNQSISYTINSGEASIVLATLRETATENVSVILPSDI